MLAAGVATWRSWRARGGAEPAVVCGHSLGEFTALVCAESIEFRAAVDLVRYRGEVMQEAVPAGTGAMAAILGLEDAEIEAACREAAAAGDGVVEPVNFNSPGQVVIAGEAAAVERAIAGGEGPRCQARGGVAGERPLAQQPDARCGRAAARPALGIESARRRACAT